MLFTVAKHNIWPSTMKRCRHVSHKLSKSARKLFTVPLANDFFLGVVADGVLVRVWCLVDLVLSRSAL